MTENNLWGDISSLETVKTPASYLIEQATLLTKAMKNVIVGVVETKPSGRRFETDLDVEVPGLNNYRYGLLTVNYPMEMYPLRINDWVNSQDYKCDSEAQFIDSLRAILSSEGVRRVLSTLKAQNFSST